MTNVAITVNGRAESREVEDRTLLVHFLRDHLGLTGTHVGCDTSQCGACVVHLDGVAVKSCTILAAAANGGTVTTIEGLANGDQLHPVQAAFREHHGLQCGFCTPGFLITLLEFLQNNPSPTEEEARDAISGNLCRCTGYQGIVAATLDAADRLRSRKERPT